MKYKIQTNKQTSVIGPKTIPAEEHQRRPILTSLSLATLHLAAVKRCAAHIPLPYLLQAHSVCGGSTLGIYASYNTTFVCTPLNTTDDG